VISKLEEGWSGCGLKKRKGGVGARPDVVVEVDLRVQSIIVGGTVTGLKRERATECSDLTLTVRTVIMRREGAGRLRDRTLERSCDWTRRGCVRLSLMYTGVTALREACTNWTLGRVRSLMTWRVRSLKIGSGTSLKSIWCWRRLEFGYLNGASAHLLTMALNVKWLLGSNGWGLNVDMWRSSVWSDASDRKLGLSPVSSRQPNGSLRVLGLYK
jgi:hypothetical protein